LGDSPIGQFFTLGSFSKMERSNANFWATFFPR
jgi:hypothetical protein